MSKKTALIVIAVLLIGVLTISSQFSKSKIITTRLVSVSEPTYNEAARVFEGIADLQDVKTEKRYSVMLCLPTWRKPQVGGYYYLDLTEYKRGVNSISAETAGCYTKPLQRVWK